MKFFKKIMVLTTILETMENIELSEVCYEHIKDTFYYGVFGDFKLVIDKTTGYFNATKLCDAADKKFYNWTRLEKSKTMISYYKEKLALTCEGQLLKEVKLQNNHNLNKQITGTYVPKELILDIASWVSIEFYDRCNSIIINYFVKEFKKMDKNDLKNKIKEVEEYRERLVKLTLEKDAVIKVKDDKIDELKELLLKHEEERKLERAKDAEYMRSLGITLNEVRDQNDTLIDKTKGLKKQNKDIQLKLGIAVEDRAPLPEDKSKRERFILIKRNDRDYYGYYIMRAQDQYINRRLKNEKLNFPNLEVLLDFKCNPNSKTLYTRIKENLITKNVTFVRNNIDLEDSHITEEDLIMEMRTVNESKYDVEKF